MLEVGPPDEPRLTVRASPVVGDRKPVEAEHAGPAGGEMKRRGAANAAEPYDDHVELHHGPEIIPDAPVGQALACHAFSLSRFSK